MKEKDVVYILFKSLNKLRNGENPELPIYFYRIRWCFSLDADSYPRPRAIHDIRSHSFLHVLLHHAGRN